MFNELYGTYYHLLERILDDAHQTAITPDAIRAIVAADGFAESIVYFTPAAVAQDGSGYRLLVQSAGGYSSILQRKPVRTETLQQKRLIKTLLQDRRIRLFLDDAALVALAEALRDIQPLFNIQDVAWTEVAADGDPYDNQAYIDRFRIILSAVKNRKGLRLVYDTPRGGRKTIQVVPCKLEYGIRDDKFRLCALDDRESRQQRLIRLNLARIQQVQVLDDRFGVDIQEILQDRLLKEPVTIEVKDLRNGFERIFIGLSNYRRQSVYNEATRTCTMKINCLADDLQDLLILLLSFGPAIKVIGPDDFRNAWLDRLHRQVAMLEG